MQGESSQSGLKSTNDCLNQQCLFHMLCLISTCDHVIDKYTKSLRLLQQNMQ